MAELEIDKEDIYDRKKCRGNVMKKKSYRKMDYKLIIIKTYNSVHDAETLSNSSYTHNAWLTPECDIIQEG